MTEFLKLIPPSEALDKLLSNLQVVIKYEMVNSKLWVTKACQYLAQNQLQVPDASYCNLRHIVPKGSRSQATLTNVSSKVYPHTFHINIIKFHFGTPLKHKNLSFGYKFDDLH